MTCDVACHPGHFSSHICVFGQFLVTFECPTQKSGAQLTSRAFGDPSEVSFRFEIVDFRRASAADALLAKRCRRPNGSKSHQIWTRSGSGSRGTSSCDLFSMRDTAHCLNFDALWYSVFEVQEPQIHYDLVVRLLTPSSYDGWSNVSYAETQLVLSHQAPSSGVEGLRAELVGDLATAVAPQRFESKCAGRWILVPIEIN